MIVGTHVPVLELFALLKEYLEVQSDSFDRDQLLAFYLKDKAFSEFVLERTDSLSLIELLAQESKDQSLAAQASQKAITTWKITVNKIIFPKHPQPSFKADKLPPLNNKDLYFSYKYLIVWVFITTHTR